MGDRHKGPRSFPSGSQKRKAASEKEKKIQETLAKMPKISTFFSPQPDPCSGGTLGTSQKAAEDKPSSPAEILEGEFSAPSPSAGISEAGANVELHPLHQVEENVAVNLKSDVGLWSPPFDDNMIDFWVRKKSTEIQNLDENLFSLFSIAQARQDQSDTERKCSKALFYRKNKNQELLNRFWLCFSPSTGKVYCYICKLLAMQSPSNLVSGGFCDWKHASERLSQHELSKEHVNALIAFRTRSNNLGRIDRALQQQVISFFIIFQDVYETYKIMH